MSGIIFTSIISSEVQVHQAEAEEGWHSGYDIDEFLEMVNGLPPSATGGTENIEKLASMPADWIQTAYASESSRMNYCKNHLLGKIPESIADFRTFYTTRRELLRWRIVEMVAAKDAEAEQV